MAWYSAWGSQRRTKVLFFSLFMTILDSINKIYKIFWTISHFSYTSRGKVTICYRKCSGLIVISLLFVLYNIVRLFDRCRFGGADLQHARGLCYNNDLFTVYKWPDKKNSDWTTKDKPDKALKCTLLSRGVWLLSLVLSERVHFALKTKEASCKQCDLSWM